ncbi:hypothetical protein ABBQ38_014921 [Trebouxia sp. C0009 RCD-2024]
MAVRGVGSDAERELWRQTRKYINDYEDKAAELQLDLRRERNTLDSAVKRQKETKNEIQQQRQRAEQSQRHCNEQRIALLALQKQSQTLTCEAARLSQQLQMLQKDVQDKQQLHKHTRDLYSAHLQEQQATVEEYTSHCNYNP